ncbi:MAG TPA: SIS domain-containing protein [Gemmatimonadaceae bacterium]|jgi:D-sedoheptulose 7-phosphate isomerase|nr:SIS domain-containing protein [Gemmatimonadaceae bacterium]
MITASRLATDVEERLLARNRLNAEFFARESERLAEICRAMAERFLDGGRLLAFGRGPYATDAQHVSVEFVHPVIVGKRALPALDLSPLFPQWAHALAQPHDIAMGFGPPAGDPDVHEVLRTLGARGVMTFALPGSEGSYAIARVTDDPFMHQELIEILYHTLWETVHVFFEHRELGHDMGETEFLYPYLGRGSGESPTLVSDVAASIRAKVEDDAALRARVASEESEMIGDVSVAIADRLARGGKLIMFGNGGSATDANDWAIDCVAPPAEFRPVPAVSLAFEPANLTAIANDVGTDVMFVRQLIAHAQPNDVAIAISTSGGSRNLIAALEEARKRGLHTVALLGYDGGEIGRRGIADQRVIVRSDYIPRIQEVQASIYHIIREQLEALHNGSL